MTLPLERLCNTFLHWLREQMTSNNEKGGDQWKAFDAWLHTPPVPRTAGPAAAPARVSAPTRAAVLRAQAEAQVGDAGAAFQAFVSS